MGEEEMEDVGDVFLRHGCMMHGQGVFFCRVFFADGARDARGILRAGGGACDEQEDKQPEGACA
ncbi:hypothetical protein GCM10011511_47400 [Puia dinghuensis]|uniref:Uncharacterized protein n=1 Tax=Puia dinghuensis TaxID=1792502 RepID=A0A8J2UHM2_9BACT|nr:hypothetical protein GCM10011511_47400 [Puia dinghuensis]